MEVDTKTTQKVTRKKGGLITMPFIIGDTCAHNFSFRKILFHFDSSNYMLHYTANETLDKVASFGLHANMALYLTTKYHMDNAVAINIIFLWGAISNFLPIFGAFLSDAHLGRFRTIALGTFISLLVSN